MRNGDRTLCIRAHRQARNAQISRFLLYPAGIGYCQPAVKYQESWGQTLNCDQEKEMGSNLEL